MAKVRHRLAKEGGADADIVRLEDAKKAAREDSASGASKERSEPFRGEFS